MKFGTIVNADFEELQRVVSGQVKGILYTPRLEIGYRKILPFIGDGVFLPSAHPMDTNPVGLALGRLAIKVYTCVAHRSHILHPSAGGLHAKAYTDALGGGRETYDEASIVAGEFPNVLGNSGFEAGGQTVVTLAYLLVPPTTRDAGFLLIHGIHPLHLRRELYTDEKCQQQGKNVFHVFGCFYGLILVYYMSFKIEREHYHLGLHLAH